jgi:hypothetical protein
MARLLVIPDLHLHHHQADTILGWEESYDQAIFLGDYFHQFGDTAEQNADAARWLKEKLDDPRRIYLLGNHDVGQRFWPENQWAFCSGCTEVKSFVVRQILGDADWDKMRIYYSLPEFNILFSHAGLDPYLFNTIAQAGFEVPKGALTLSAITSWLDAVWPSIVVRYRAGSIHPLLEAGASRGGLQRGAGGITWQDFQELTPIHGLIQIVGHTPQDPAPLFRFHQGRDVQAPMWRRVTKSINPRALKYGCALDLDTHLKHYAIINTKDPSLTIKSVHWHRAPAKEIGAIDKEPWEVEPGKEILQVRLPRVGPDGEWI